MIIYMEIFLLLMLFFLYGLVFLWGFINNKFDDYKEIHFYSGGYPIKQERKDLKK